MGYVPLYKIIAIKLDRMVRVVGKPAVGRLGPPLGVHNTISMEHTIYMDCPEMTG